MSADEMKALDEEIQKRQKRLDTILKGDLKPRLRNYRYVVDFDFPLADQSNIRADGAPYVQVQKSFVVKKGTLFDVMAIETAFTAVGTLASTGEAAQLTLPVWLREIVFDYYFGIYDSGSDRSWQNQLLPSWVLASENRNGFWFSGPDSDGRGLLSGGSELVVTLAPWKNRDDAYQTGLSSVSSYNIQMSFVGVEVML